MFVTMSITHLHPSPTNPRKTFDEGLLAELTESIRQHGILQPILVRPMADTPAEADAPWHAAYEIVAGERRYRAARAAGLDMVPCHVRELDDRQTLEVQYIENLQREDLHPVEEAEGYAALMQHGYTVEDLAAKLARSPSYVYARLKLTALTEKGRKAFMEGKVTPSIALILARIPAAKLQDEALKFWLETRVSAEQFREEVRRRYMLQLSGGGFKTSDPDLVPAAGACTTCPKSSGAQGELFADMELGKSNYCLDPPCFQRKREAAAKQRIAAAKAEGLNVIDGKEAKKLAPHGVRYSGPPGYVQLDQRAYEVGEYNKTYRKLLGKNCPPPTLFVDPTDKGNLVEVLPQSHLKAALKAVGIKRSVSTGSGGNRAEKEREERARNEVRVRAKIHDAIRRQYWGCPTGPDHGDRGGIDFDLRLEPDDLRLITSTVWARWWNADQQLLLKLSPWQEIVADVHSRHAHEPPDGAGDDAEDSDDAEYEIHLPKGVLRWWIDHEATESGLSLLLLDLALIPEVLAPRPYNDAPATKLERVAKAHGVFPDAIRREEQARIDQAAEEKAARREGRKKTAKTTTRRRKAA